MLEGCLTPKKNILKIRHIMGQEMFNYMAAYSPAFGMMGTVMGLGCYDEWFWRSKCFRC